MGVFEIEQEIEMEGKGRRPEKKKAKEKNKRKSAWRERLQLLPGCGTELWNGLVDAQCYKALTLGLNQAVLSSPRSRHSLQISHCLQKCFGCTCIL